MAASILYCIPCKKYTLKASCPACDKPTVQPRPPKFSIQDKYAAYRREEKRKELEEKGMY